MALATSLDPRRHASQSGWKPEEAIGFSSEGGIFGLKFSDPLEPSVADHGVTEEEWAHANALLRTSWSPFSKLPTIRVIEELNTSLFARKGLVAVYAEHGAAQKAMTIYSEERFADLFPEVLLEAEQHQPKVTGAVPTSTPPPRTLTLSLAVQTRCSCTVSLASSPE